MKYDNPELQHRLAAEYVLGTLQGPARLRFERLLAGSEALRRKVSAWELRLSPWTAAVKTVPVPAHVWMGVQRRLGFTAAPDVPEKLPGLWRWWAYGSTAVAAVFAVLLIMQPAVLPPEIVPVATRDLAVLSTDKAEAVWIVRARHDGKTLEFSGLSNVSLPADRELELWAIPAEGAPLSLGVMKMSNGRHAEVVLTAGVKSRLAQGVALAISLEPAGGSITGAPTGPVLYSGKLQG